MHIALKRFIVTLCFLSIVSCTPTKHEMALIPYQKAIEEKNLAQLLSALTKLIQLAPEKYQTEFNKIESANKQFKEAKNQLENANPYLAYIEIHDSYHSFPNDQSKQILLESGKIMLTLLRVDSLLNKSSHALPSSLQHRVLSYSKSDITEWDLIAVNKLLENVDKSLNGLTNTLAIIKQNKFDAYTPDFSLWTESISKQKEQIITIKHHLINAALGQSALQLKQHNQILVADVEDLLSLVREKLATQTLQPLFLKTQQQYQPYLIVNENLSLSGSNAKRNQHSPWYAGWQQLESDTLTMPNSLANYRSQNEQRIKQFNQHIAQGQSSLAALSGKPLLINNNILLHPKINALITKLKKDKTLLLYGAPTAKK